MTITKEAWLESIRNYKPPPKETITMAEYRILPILAQFKCPIGYRDQLSCDGHNCIDLETETKCREAMTWRAKLVKVQKGMIDVV